MVEDFYVKLKTTKVTEEGNSFPISGRQLDALRRLAQAHARTRLSHTIEKEDIEMAKKLMMYYLRNVGFDPILNQFDVDIVQTGGKSLNRLHKEEEICRYIKEKKSEIEGPVPEELIVAHMEKEYNLKEEVIERLLNKLKREGMLFEPKNGHYVVI